MEAVCNTINKIKITDILKDKRYQVRKKLDAGRVQSYRSSYAAEVDLGPIKVAHVGRTLILVDGWHRITALQSLGIDAVEAEIIKATEKEALWLAAQANLMHGLPLKSSEMRKVFKAYMRSGMYRKNRRSFKSFREIAIELGGSKHHTTIRLWMRKDFPKTAARYSPEDYPKNTGSHTPVPLLGSFRDTSENALNDAFNAFKNVGEIGDKLSLIGLAEKTLESMRKDIDHLDPYG